MERNGSREEPPRTPFAAIEQAVDDIRAGRMLVVVDDEDRENEGDLVMAAEKVTPQAINFMATHGRGLICVPLPGERLDALEIPPMVARSPDSTETDFAVSVDAREGIATGISAQDRARTVRLLADPQASASDLRRPGHIFPLRAREAGVLQRPGHTEAAVDLARLAGLRPAGIVCEIMNEDGTMARLPHLGAFARRHGLNVVQIADLVRHRLQRERLVQRVSSERLSTRHGQFAVHVYRDAFTGHTVPALVAGQIRPDRPVLVRIHPECVAGDIFDAVSCGCGRDLDAAMAHIGSQGEAGVLLYLRRNGRGPAPERARHPAPPDLRDLGVGAQILDELGVTSVRLLTGASDGGADLDGFSLEVVERVPLRVPAGRSEASRDAVRTSALGSQRVP